MLQFTAPSPEPYELVEAEATMATSPKIAEGIQERDLKEMVGIVVSDHRNL